jgi:choline monooxygenase
MNSTSDTLDWLYAAPIERAYTLPSFVYTQSEWNDIDRDQVLSSRWQYAGDVHRLQQAGDVRVLNLLDQPILVVKDQQHQIRAFYNVCKHRGGPIATEDQYCKFLQCRYHGWTYTLEGQLRGVPKFKYTELFDKKDFGLTEIPVQLWEGLIFVCLGEQADTLENMVKGISDQIKPLELTDFRFHHRVTYTIACNWKVYADNYLEGYHVPHVHPELCKLLDMDAYETRLQGNNILQVSPLKNKNSIYAGGDDTAWYYFVYPNMMLNILPGRMQLNQILPINAGHCMVHFDYYYTDQALQAHPKLLQEDLAYSEEIQAEDIRICEHVQQGLASKAYHRGRFSVETEQGPYHFQERLKADYARSL